MDEKSWNHVDAAHCKLRFVFAGMNPKATQDDYNEVMSCVRAGYKRLKLSSLGFGLKKYLKKKLEFFLFTTNPRLLCKLKKKELR